MVKKSSAFHVKYYIELEATGEKQTSPAYTIILIMQGGDIYDDIQGHYISYCSVHVPSQEIWAKVYPATIMLPSSGPRTNTLGVLTTIIMWNLGPVWV